jgi:hypothetical protein
VWRDDECGFLYNSPKPGGSEYNRGYTEDNGETTPVMAASSSGLAEYRSDMVPTSLLVAHWGRLGAGPRITARMTEALAAVQGVEVIASIDVNADSIPALPADDIRLENTYTRRWEILFRLPRLIALSLRTRRWMNQRGIQVYFSPMMSIWGALAIWLMVPRSVQAVVVVHDAQQHPGDRHPLLEVCRRVEIARADVLVAFSKHSADELRKHVSRKKRIIWVPHGTDVDTTLAPRLAPRDQPIVGFFGRISEYKGIDLFVDSIRSLRDQVPSARGRVVGDGDVPDGLMDESKRDIEWRVGWVDEHEVETVVDRGASACGLTRCPGGRDPGRWPRGAGGSAGERRHRWCNGDDRCRGRDRAPADGPRSILGALPNRDRTVRGRHELGLGRPSTSGAAGDGQGLISVTRAC